MIRHPNSAPRHHDMPADSATAAPVPGWLRQAVADAQTGAGKGVGPKALEEIALVSGAALCALDQVVRREERWAGAWRQRLALAAAALAAKQAGRIEDEAALRDAWCLRPSGSGLAGEGSTSLGPAGLLLLAWRGLAARPAPELLTAKNLAAVTEAFGYAGDAEAVGDLADALRQLSATGGIAGIPAGAFTAAERTGFGRVIGAWCADALLAQRLGWRHAVPLLGAEAAWSTRAASRRRDLEPRAQEADEVQGDRAKSLLAAQARAALRAIDLSADLGRRAEKLLAVAPKLRAKGAEAIVERLLSEDALIASRGGQNNGISDRGLRRLFDRLVSLSAVRELSGRPTFRIYGL